MTVRILRELAAEPARDFLRSELGGKVVQVIGECRIHYQGRAQSTLSQGDRLILLKPDGTLLVHTDAKLKPVNWQPPGCSFQAGLTEEDDGERLVLTATRTSPREIVRMTFSEVHAVASFELRDDEDLELVGTEDDLQALLHERPELLEEGFTPWKRERASGRGPMDLYGEDEDGNRVVVEVKRRNASVQEVEQLRRYVEKEREAREGHVRGILACPSVSDKARRYLAELGFEYRELDWDRLLPLVREVLPAGQKTLGDWGEDDE